MTEWFVPVLIWLALWSLGSWLLRACFGGLLKPLRRLHPKDASWVLLLLILMPATLTAILLVAVKDGLGGHILSHCHGDMCASHTPQTHYPFWLALPAVVVVMAAIYRSAQAALSYLRKMQQLSRVAERREGWLVLPIAEPLAFAIGFIKPHLVVTAGLLKALPGRAMDIIAAHERAHSRRGDNLRLLLAKIALIPLFNQRDKLLNELELYHEQASDLEACREHCAEDVAQTIIDVTRLNHGVRRGLSVSYFDGSHIEARVRLLLQSQQPVSQPIRHLLLLATISALLVLALVDPLHILLELFH